jgi:hypothetical protein
MDRPYLAWKLLLRSRLPQVLARLFPDVHGSIDWPRGYGLPDNNIPPVSADSRTGDRAVDFTAIVLLLDGTQTCLHVEIQCCRQAGFADRMALYHARLRDRFAIPVISLAIFGDASPAWRPDFATDLRGGYGTTFQFRIAKLLDFRPHMDRLIASLEPVDLVLAAHLLGLDTRRRMDLRYPAKLRLLQSLHAHQSTTGELNELQTIIDWLIPLPAERQRRLAMDIEQFILDHEKEDKNSLNYLIPEVILQRCKKQAAAVGAAEGEARGRAIGEACGQAIGEARGEARGQARGEASGQRQTLKLQLEVQFGKLPPKLLRALDRADPRQLERLAIALLDASSLEGALSSAGVNF